MSAVVTPIAMTIELLDWVASDRRTYREVMDAWTSNCPRHPVWDDAVSDGLVEVVHGVVALTARGREFIVAVGYNRVRGVPEVLL